MAEYDRHWLSSCLGTMSSGDPEVWFADVIMPYLAELWLDEYSAAVGDARMVQVSEAGFSYLFDVAHGRLVAAWGISRGKHSGARDKHRMRGHPRSGGPRYHRGHAIPHTLGGGTDINLVAQLGSVNVGPFRPLEKRAVATPGSLYFTHWIYSPGGGATPVAVEQGLLSAGARAEIVRHRN